MTTKTKIKREHGKEEDERYRRRGRDKKMKEPRGKDGKKGGKE